MDKQNIYSYHAQYITRMKIDGRWNWYTYYLLTILPPKNQQQHLYRCIYKCLKCILYIYKVVLDIVLLLSARVWHKSAKLSIINNKSWTPH